MNSSTTLALRTAPAIALFLICHYAFGLSDGKKKSLSRKENDPEVCLEISGSLAAELRSAGGTYVVKVIQDNKIVDQFMLTAREKFRLYLKKDNWYTIRIEKEGFIPRLVSINTALPQNARKNSLYRFQFDMYLFSEAFSRYFDADDIDFPIALIAYDSEKRLFDYDKNYTSQIQAKMHCMSSTAR